MSAHGYAYSLAAKGHSAQSILLMTGVDVGQSRVRRTEYVRSDGPPPPPKPVTLGPPAYTMRMKARATIANVAYERGVSVEEIMGRRRMHRVVYPRQEAMYLMLKRYRLSLPHIGRIFDRHHTTVLHDIKAHCERNGLSYDEIKRPEGNPWTTARSVDPS